MKLVLKTHIKPFDGPITAPASLCNCLASKFVGEANVVRIERVLLGVLGAAAIF